MYVLFYYQPHINTSLQGDQKYHAKHPNPFADEDEEVASVVYR